MVFLSNLTSFQEQLDHRGTFIWEIKRQLEACQEEETFAVQFEVQSLRWERPRALSFVLRSPQLQEGVEFDVLPAFDVLGERSQTQGLSPLSHHRAAFFFHISEQNFPTVGESYRDGASLRRGWVEILERIRSRPATGATLSGKLAQLGGKTSLTEHLLGWPALLVAKRVNFSFLKGRQCRSSLRSVREFHLLPQTGGNPAGLVLRAGVYIDDPQPHLDRKQNLSGAQFLHSESWQNHATYVLLLSIERASAFSCHTGPGA